MKGQAGDAKVKEAAAIRWCKAVNNDGRFGRWTYYLCFGVKESSGTGGHGGGEGRVRVGGVS